VRHSEDRLKFVIRGRRFPPRRGRRESCPDLLALFSHYLDCGGASASNAAALCNAVFGRPDIACAVTRGSAGRHGLRGHPNCGSHDGPGRKFGPGRRLEVWGGPRLRLVQQKQQSTTTN